jgi:hypothetical protein
MELWNEVILPGASYIFYCIDWCALALPIRIREMLLSSHGYFGFNVM